MDPNTVRELNQRFSELTSTSSSLGSSFTSTRTQSDKLSEAFEKLSKQVNKNTQTNKESGEITEKTIEAEKKALSVTEKRTKAEEEATKVAIENSKKQGDAARGIMAQTSSVDGLLSVLSDRLIALAGGGIGATIAIKGLSTVVEGGIKILQASYEAQVNYTKSLLAGERGQILVARQATQVGKSFNELVSNLGSVAMGVGGIAAILGGPFTMLLGGLAAAGGVGAKIFAHLSNTALELNEQLAGLRDKLFQGFNELGKASMIGAGGMTELHRQLNELGLTMAEVSEFTGLVKGAGKELKLLGDSTSEGLKSFVKTTGTLLKSDLGKTLEIMGITAADQRESMISFLTTEARLGKSRITDQEKLNKAAFNYIIEMDKLAELTGATRKEQEEARNQILAIEELRAAMLDEQDAAEKEKLERALKNAETLYAAGAKGLAAGVAKYFAAGEAMTSPEAVKTFQSAPQLLDRISKGQGTVAENMVLAATEMKDQAKQFASVGRLNAEAIKAVLAEGFGVTSDFYKRLKDAPEAAKKMGLSLDDYLKKQREVTDEQTKAQVELVRKQRETAIMEEKSAGTMSHAADKFKESVYYLLEKLGFNEKNIEKLQGSVGVGKEIDIAAGAVGGEGAIQETVMPLSQKLMYENARKAYEKSLEGGTFTQRTFGMGLTEQQQSFKQLRGKALEGGLSKEEQIAINKQVYGEDPLAKLNFGGQRKERTGGGEVDPSLVALAHKVTEEFPGVVITSLNDKYHQENHKTSKHTVGKAMDFATNPAPKDAEEAAKIVERLKDMGASIVKDEYFKDKTSKTTGGHFHVEIAHNGGYFKSSLGDFPVLLKNDEYVLTNQMVENLKSKLEDSVTKSPIESVFPEATSPATTSKNTEMGDMITMFIQSQEVISEKLDTMIDVLESGLSLQDKLVKYART